jgi:hypothetical protein
MTAYIKTPPEPYVYNYNELWASLLDLSSFEPKWEMMTEPRFKDLSISFPFATTDDSCFSKVEEVVKVRMAF